MPMVLCRKPSVLPMSTTTLLNMLKTPISHRWLPLICPRAPKRYMTSQDNLPVCFTLISHFSPSFVLDGSTDQRPPGAAGEAERQRLQGVCVFALGADRLGKLSVCTTVLLFVWKKILSCDERMPPPTGRVGVWGGRKAERHHGNQRDDGEEFRETSRVNEDRWGNPHRWDPGTSIWICFKHI